MHTELHAAPSQLPLKRHLALALLLLMLAVVVTSAWLRLAQPRPGCAEWPGCRSEQRHVSSTPAAAVRADPTMLGAVRATHRIAASAALLAVIVLGALALARTPRDPALGRRALAMLVLALGLAALGVITPGSRSVAVMLGNLLGGLLLLAAAWATWRELGGAPRPTRSLARWAWAGAALWLLQAALGALSGAGVPGPGPVLHVALALLAAPWAFALGARARRQGCLTDGRALMVLAVLQVLLGLSAVASRAAPPVVLAHNAMAAAGIALLVAFALASGSAARPGAAPVHRN